MTFASLLSVRDIQPLPSQQPVARIQAIVAEAYGISPRMMWSHDRHRYVTWPRQVAMYLVRETTHKSFPNIAKLFGGVDHTTVMHALKAVEKRMATIPFYRDDVEALRARVGRRGSSE